MHAPVLAAFALLATSVMGTPKTDAKVFTSLSQLNTEPEGYVHVGDDGVARSYSANDTVIDYVPLTNNQLMEMLGNLPASYDSEMDHLHEVFDNVTGLDVTNESQLLDPPAWLRRPALKRDAAPLPVTSNPESDVKTNLQTRQYCVGRPCLTTAGCQFSGCSTCAYLDAVLPGGGGVCLA